MRGETTLSGGAIFELGAVGVDLVGAVVLLVSLAVVAGQVCADLSSYADTVADLDGLDRLADLDGTADDLVAGYDRQGCFAPAAGDGVDI